MNDAITTMTFSAFGKLILLSFAKHGVIVDRVVTKYHIADQKSQELIPNTNHLAEGIYVTVPQSSFITDENGDELSGMRLARFAKGLCNATATDDIPMDRRIPVFAKVRPDYHWTPMLQMLSVMNTRAVLKNLFNGAPSEE